MAKSIENYIPLVGIKKTRRGAFFRWSISGFLVFAWVFLILLAPVAESNNLTGISNPIYKFFSHICHQIPARSFYLENHAFAVCSRCFGIYFGLLIGFIVYPFFRSLENIEPLPRVWLFLAMLPMAIDWSLGFFGVWENTHWSRFLTGLILGAACAIFIVPALVEISRLFFSKKQTKRLSR